MVNLLGSWHGQNRVNSIGRIWGKAGSKEGTCTQVPGSDESEAGGCLAAELEKEGTRPLREKSYQILHVSDSQAVGAQSLVSLLKIIEGLRYFYVGYIHRYSP